MTDTTKYVFPLVTFYDGFQDDNLTKLVLENFEKDIPARIRNTISSGNACMGLITNFSEWAARNDEMKEFLSSHEIVRLGTLLLFPNKEVRLLFMISFSSE